MKEKNSVEDFVKKWIEAYQIGKGYDWIGEELGCSKQAVQQRAAKLKYSGVHLPNLKERIKERADFLNALIDRELQRNSDL